MARVTLDSSTVELYGKEVRRQFWFVPFPFHRAIPHESGYEFFLLLRPRADSRATIIHRRVIPPSDVIVERNSHGGTSDHVGATLRYDAGPRTATVSIKGLKRPVVDDVKLDGIR
jgi:hypothetical protein